MRSCGPRSPGEQCRRGQRDQQHPRCSPACRIRRYIERPACAAARAGSAGDGRNEALPAQLPNLGSSCWMIRACERPFTRPLSAEVVLGGRGAGGWRAFGAHVSAAPAIFPRERRGGPRCVPPEQTRLPVLEAWACGAELRRSAPRTPASARRWSGKEPSPRACAARSRRDAAYRRGELPRADEGTRSARSRCPTSNPLRAGAREALGGHDPL
jgi:hypothetical protein